MRSQNVPNYKVVFIESHQVFFIRRKFDFFNILMRKLVNFNKAGSSSYCNPLDVESDQVSASWRPLDLPLSPTLALLLLVPSVVERVKCLGNRIVPKNLSLALSFSTEAEH